MADLKIVELPPTTEGLDTDSAPDALADGRCLDLSNFLLHLPGMLPMRGPLPQHSPVERLFVPDDWPEPPPPQSPAIITGIWSHENNVAVGYAELSAENCLEPWRVGRHDDDSGTTQDYNYARAATGGIARSLRWSWYSGEPALAGAPSTGAHYTNFTGRGVRAGNWVYGFEYSRPETPEPGDGMITDGRRQYVARRMVGWSGNASSNDPSGWKVYDTAPGNGADMELFLNRLWILAGSDRPDSGSNAMMEPDALYYSIQIDPNGPIADDVSEWMDDYSGGLGTTNKFIIDSGSDNDYGVALRKLGPELIIWKRRSMWKLSGYSSDTFELTPIHNSIGCVDARSVQAVAGGVLWLGDNGYYFYDGTQITNLVAERLSAEVNEATARTVGMQSVPGGFAVTIPLRDDYVLLSIGAQDFGSGRIRTDLPSCAFLIHTLTGRWSRFSSTVLGGVPTRGAVGPDYVMIGDQFSRFKRADYITRPSGVPEAQRGYDVLDTRVGAQESSWIPARWESPIVSLFTPGYMSQLHRLFIDHTARVVDSDAVPYGWTLSVSNGNGQRISGPYRIPNYQTTALYPYRRRAVRDDFSEAHDCQITMTWEPDALDPSNLLAQGVAHASIQTTGIEFQPTRQRRSS